MINMEARLSCNEITLYTKVDVLRLLREQDGGARLPRERTLSFLREIVAECPAIATAMPPNVRQSRHETQRDEMRPWTCNPEVKRFAT